MCWFGHNFCQCTSIHIVFVVYMSIKTTETCISLSSVHFFSSLNRLKAINIVLRRFSLLINCRLQAGMCGHFHLSRKQHAAPVIIAEVLVSCHMQWWQTFWKFSNRTKGKDEGALKYSEFEFVRDWIRRPRSVKWKLVLTRGGLFYMLLQESQHCLTFGNISKRLLTLVNVCLC